MLRKILRFLLVSILVLAIWAGAVVYGMSLPLTDDAIHRTLLYWLLLAIVCWRARRIAKGLLNLAVSGGEYNHSTVYRALMSNRFQRPRSDD